MITFYGTEESLRGWIDIIEQDLDKVCGSIEDEDGRLKFDVELTDEDRDYLQENYWNMTQDGSDMPWNWRIAYSGVSAHV